MTKEFRTKVHGEVVQISVIDFHTLVVPELFPEIIWLVLDSEGPQLLVAWQWFD
jgi:hypothetical protein